MMSSKSKIAWVLAIVVRGAVALALILVAVQITQYLILTKIEPPRRDVGDNLPTVATLTLRPMPVQRSWQAIGTVNAVNAADLTAEVGGLVIERPLRAGDRVKPSQVIVQIDARDYEVQRDLAAESLRQIEQSRAQLAVEEAQIQRQIVLERDNMAVAQRNLERIQKLAEMNASTPQDLDAATQSVLASSLSLARLEERLMLIPSRRTGLESQLIAARRSLEQAKLNVERCTLFSPMEGVVQELMIEVGQRVAPGQMLARVVDVSHVEIPMRLPALARSFVRKGDAVEISSDAAPGQVWKSEAVRIAPEDDVRTRTVTVYAEVRQESLERPDPSPTARLLTPNMFITARINSGDSEDRWVVPRRSVRSGFVLVVEEGQLRSIAVEADYSIEGRMPASGLPDEQWIVLRDNANLKLGATVVLNAGASLLDGQKVKPVHAAVVNGVTVSTPLPESGS